MMKKVLFLSGMMLVFSACGFSVDVDMGGSDETTDEISEENAVEVPEVVEVQTGDELVSVDATWNLYKNYDEGYSIKVPKETKVYNCSGDGAQDLVPVKVLKDGNVSFVTSEYSYNFANGCTKYDVETIPEERATTWKILSEDVSGEEELLSFVKDRYGEGCSLNQIHDNGDVEINTTDPDGGCFINYITSMRYNENKGKAYSFDIGQDYNFYNGSESYDTSMAESFSFLD